MKKLFGQLFFTLIFVNFVNAMETNVLSTTFNTAGRIMLDNQIPEGLKNLWKNPQIKSERGDIYKEVMYANRGVMISNTHLKDVVSFIDRYYWYEPLTAVHRERMQSRSLDEAIHNQNYIDMIFLLKNVPSKQERIEWLEQQAKAGHCICMFELCKELAETNDQSKIKEINTWFVRALIRLTQDIACHDDQSVKAAKEILGGTYRILLGNFFVPDSNESLAIKKEAVQWIKQLHNVPVSYWIGYHGLQAFEGPVTFLPEHECARRRIQVLEEYEKALH